MPSKGSVQLDSGARHLEATAKHILNLTPGIRYVALYVDGQLHTLQREGLDGASAEDSDRFEELFVNPALLVLAKQRGDLDCGGLRHLVVAYGNFFQLVVPIPGGHASVAFEQTYDPFEHEQSIRRTLLEALASPNLSGR